MDKELARLIDEDTPHLQRELAEGYARAVMQVDPRDRSSGVYGYVDKLMRIAAQSFPPQLEYLDWQLTTPEEDYKYQVRVQNRIAVDRRTGKRTKERTKVQMLDVARSDVVLLQYFFRWRGEAFTRFLYLPFVGPAGTMYLNGTRFHIAPVLVDEVITKRGDHVFIRLVKTRFRVRRDYTHYMANGRRERVNLHYAKLFHNKKHGLHPAVRGHTTLVHYLLCKFGFAGTFLKLGQEVPVIGGLEINEVTHPPDQWVICASTGVPPKIARKRAWRAPALRLAVRQEHYTLVMRKLIGAIFYLADLFPMRAVPEYMEDVRQWRILLGLLTYRTDRGEGELQGVIERHMEWLEEYIDPLSREKLAHLGDWPTDSLFDVLAYIVLHYDFWYITDKAPGPTMYGKHLEVLAYLMSSVRDGINNVVYELRRYPATARFPLQRVQNIFNRHLNPYVFFKVRKGGHSELMTTPAANDNLALKLTSRMVQQDRYQPPAYRDDEKGEYLRTGAINRHELLHASVAEVAQFLNLSASSPDGRDHTNLHVGVSGNGFVQRNPRYQDLIDQAQWDLYTRGAWVDEQHLQRLKEENDE